MTELILREETLHKMGDALRRAGLSEQQTIGAANLLESLPDSMLEYRTVDLL